MRKRIIFPLEVKRRRYKRSKENEIISYRLPIRYNLRCRNIVKRKTPSSLEDLNDDCLFHLFPFLEVPASLKLGLINERFANFTKESLKSAVFNVMQLKEQFSLSYAEIALSKFGPYIRKLSFKLTKIFNEDGQILTSYVELLAKYCCNVESISSPAVLFEFIDKSLLKSCKTTLESLTISGYSLIDPHSYLIGYLKNLKYLKLNCARITGKYLTRLTNLTHLDLKNCWNIDPVSFEKICERNHLKVLSIVDCYHLDDEAFCKLVETQWECLESLEIAFAYSRADIKILSLLMALTEIKILHAPHAARDDTFLKYFVERKKETLKSLQLDYDYVCTLTKDELDSILELSNLEKLQLNVFPIDKDYLLEMSKRLVNLEVLEVRPIGSVKYKMMIDIVKRFNKLKYCSMYYV